MTAPTPAVTVNGQPVPETTGTRMVAPELAASMAETRLLRELLDEVLGHFTPTGSGHAARVGQVQIAKWRKRAGLPPS